MGPEGHERSIHSGIWRGEHTRRGEGKYPEVGMNLADLQSREETAPSGEGSADEARDGGGVRGSERSRLGFWQLL